MPSYRHRDSGVVLSVGDDYAGSLSISEWEPVVSEPSETEAPKADESKPRRTSRRPASDTK